MTGPVLEAPTPGGVWGRIIGGKPYPCTVQSREAASNPGPLGTSGEYFTTAPGPSKKPFLYKYKYT
jgi:hypothetical protein